MNYATRLALLVPALCLPLACQGPAESSGAGDAPQGGGSADSRGDWTVHWEYTFEHLDFPNYDARHLANSVRVFLGDTQVRIEVLDERTWKVVGTPDEVELARFLAVSFDQQVMSRQHRGSVYDFQQADARQALVRARGMQGWGENWIVGAKDSARVYAMIPREETDAFDAILSELDAPR
ncbi:hypothetical protein [Engelhardtia mirabilis]|uniref:Preprotein translocase subunit SecD n=1 Tax=Engelhardtia mirabilis TaxID=2528011 RepID=A0A518BDZ0_9BACT|nr:hypothetical protein Pla133_02550 [Planctomycetes bacterium Pla133]QDU99517.1 hypothetical protein Pla86_02550 [Planctomycetes bacterium Pla86]